MISSFWQYIRHWCVEYSGDNSNHCAKVPLLLLVYQQFKIHALQISHSLPKKWLRCWNRLTSTLKSLDSCEFICLSYWGLVKVHFLYWYNWLGHSELRSLFGMWVYCTASWSHPACMVLAVSIIFFSRILTFMFIQTGC